ncbi:MAG: hypothetical protein QGI83_07235 [Candidatus Latescibacteria bacterium]|jgi:chromosome segregation ATPase|nr:hypothetical protein [Candidatus Latescibacterota bacterium]
MSAVILAAAIVGGLIFVVFTILAYSTESAHLAAQLDELQIRLGSERSRLSEYEARVGALQEEVPLKRARCDRLERWIELLKQQRLKVETQQDAPKEPERGGRDEAVRRSLRMFRKSES